MKLEQLRQLTAIVEYGSLRAAARGLKLPQPALTRSVRALERELDVELFTRQTTGMVLTHAGRRFHRHAAAIVNEARRAREEIAQERGESAGSVSVALSIAPHVGMLPAALPEFRRRYPHVLLQITEGLLPDVEAQLRDGSLDFYLGAASRSAPGAGLAVQHLSENTRAVLCPARPSACRRAQLEAPRGRRLGDHRRRLQRRRRHRPPVRGQAWPRRGCCCAHARR